jgi:DNA-binding CsgD family transcriptional regulator
VEKNYVDEITGSIFSNGPFYFYIIDFFDKKIKYISPSVKEIHGLDPEHISNQDILDHIHPDDLPFVSKAENISRDLLSNKLDKDKNKKYKTSYCFRFRTNSGSYQLFNRQTILLASDEKGAISKLLKIHTNISHLTSVNNYEVSAIGMFGEPSMMNIAKDDFKTQLIAKPLFTKREIEIIRLMSEGFTNLEISKKLSIAHNTIKNHKKNIFRKSKCKNSVQLINKCITEGLV